jgi:hypothetical protein
MILRKYNPIIQLFIIGIDSPKLRPEAMANVLIVQGT